jgi:homeobox protein NOBOX
MDEKLNNLNYSDYNHVVRFEKRKRNVYSDCQTKRLEEIFEQTHYPDSTLRIELSHSLNISLNRIQIWFQNRRAKFKKIGN